MKTEKDIPGTLQEVVKYFADDERAFEYMKNVRWPDGKVACPRCNCERVSFISTRKKWTCLECRRQFSIKVGTIFEDSPISFEKWICATWLIANAKNGISSYEIGRALGVCQKTGWFMLQRIRLALQNGTLVKIGGTVEVDETFIGGRARLMNAKARANRKADMKTGQWHLTPVQGLLERSTKEKSSRVILKRVENNKTSTLDPNVRKYVIKGSTVNTDELSSYKEIGDEYTHNVINHAECYARGHVHTNGMENFWSLLKRTIKGTYVSVEPFHLFRYLDEQAFRFNERKDVEGDKGRFQKAIAGIVGKRLTWANLVGGEEQLPAQA
jgi:transposase-like protein